MLTHSTPDHIPADVPKELHEAWYRYKAIVKLGHPALEQVAKPVTRYNTDTHNLIHRMKTTMKEANGLGLAAPQLGVSTRIIVYDSGDGVKVLVNPKIISSKGEQLDPPEGCLSIPGLQGQVLRAKEVRVKGFDERGRAVSRRALDLEARVIQHEVDHLDGILFFQKAIPDTLEWVIGDGDDDDGNGAPRD